MARDDLFEPSFDPETATTLRAKLSARDAEIAQLKEELANARAALTPDSPGTKDMSWKGAAHYWNRVSSERGIEINKLRAELAEARERTTATVTCSRVVPTPTEIRTYMDRLADTPRTGGYVPPTTQAVEGQRPATLDEIRTVMDNIGLQSRVDQSVPPIVVAPVDPRIDALCRVVEHLADIAWDGWLDNAAFPSESINNDLLTITRPR